MKLTRLSPTFYSIPCKCVSVSFALGTITDFGSLRMDFSHVGCHNETQLVRYHAAEWKLRDKRQRMLCARELQATSTASSALGYYALRRWAL